MPVYYSGTTDWFEWKDSFEDVSTIATATAATTTTYPYVYVRYLKEEKTSFSVDAEILDKVEML